MAREHVWGHAGSSGDHETAFALCFGLLSFPFLSLPFLAFLFLIQGCIGSGGGGWESVIVIACRLSHGTCGLAEMWVDALAHESEDAWWRR